MKAKILVALILMTILANGPIPVWGETLTVANEQKNPIQEQGHFRLHVQAGINTRLNSSSGTLSDGGGGSPLQLAFSIAGMKWDKKHPTWGLGARGTVDDYGFRTGPLGFLRYPMNPGFDSYYQVAGGFYVFAGDSDLEGPIPGYFLEAEMAPGNLFALVAGLESLRYNYQEIPDFAYSGDGTNPWKTRNSKSFQLGVKFGQGIGVGFTAVLFGLAAAIAAGGGVM